MPVDSKLDFNEVNVNKNIVARSYWKDRIGDFEFIPYFNALETKSFRVTGCRSCKVEMSLDVLRQLGKIAPSSRAKHIVLLASLGILVNKYAGVTDLIIFTSGYQEDNSGIAGNGVLPFRFNGPFDKSFKELLLQVKEHFLRDIEHIGYPLERKTGHENENIKDIPAIGMILEGLQDHRSLEALNFDLLFICSVDNRLTLTIQYDAARFSEEHIYRVCHFYARVLQLVITNLMIDVSTIELVDEQEKQLLLHEFNDTCIDYPRHKTIVDLFEEQVIKTPENVAIVSRDEKMTYQELNMAANKLAHYLRDQWKVKPDDLVGVLLSRSAGLVISILAILKAGAAYVPIDPAYPASRIKTMAENSCLKGVITATEHQEKAGSENLIIYAREEERWSRLVATNPVKVTGPDDLFYVIYTSGSTGTPKGVMVKQHAVTNLVNWYARVLNMSAKDIVLLIAPIGFDLTQKNFFAPLLNGAGLYLSEQLTLNYPLIADTIREQAVTIVNVAPSAFYPLLEKEINDDYNKLVSLRKVVLGGEPINIKRIAAWSNSPYYNAQVINSYGPTECTDVVSYYEIDNEELHTSESIPIGQPVDNTQLYVLDANQQLLPVGVSGEIWIGGVGVSRGYLNNDQLTGRKFIKDPFSEEGLMYRTGDWGKWLPGGNIEFSGRIDNQVKIRGSRIELGEIEHRFNQHAAVKECVILAKEKGNEKYLVGYYVSGSMIEPAELRIFLQQELPDYMVPSFFVHLQELPLTPNGKLDRRSLPDPVISSLHQYTAPSNEIEEKLVELWAEVLEMEEDKISVATNFFDMGGDSISILKLNSKINTYFKCDIPVADMFTLPTISSVQKFIATGRQAVEPLNITLQEEDREFVLSNREN
jgi:amino acid adenylation domain-containing protein